MEGTAQIRIASRSVFGGVEDVIRMEGTATVEKTDYGWHLQYEAVNCEDEKSTIRSDVKVETATRRAILVKYNGHVYAASMNGMPHEDDTISDNDFDGHFCIHFTGSKTHGTQRVDEDHQSCVQTALKYAWK